MDYQPIQSFNIGGLTFYTWGLLFALAVGTGLIWAYFRTEEEKQDHILNLGILIIISSIAGARLAFVLVYSSLFEKVWEIFKVWEGGMISYGGFVFAVSAFFIYLKKNKLSVYKFSNIFAPPLALGIVITRIGCFLNHGHLGKITDVSWGINYLGETRHPIALYYALSALIILFLLLFLEKYKKKRINLGIILGLFYPLLRLISDQFASYRPEYVKWLNSGFLILSFLFFLYLYIQQTKQQKNQKKDSRK